MSIKLESIKHSDSAQLLLSTECAATFSSGTLLIHSSSCCCPPLPLLPSHFSLWCFSWEGCGLDTAEHLTSSLLPPPAWRLVGKGHKCVRLEATDEVKIFFRWIVFGVYQVLGRISIPQYSLLLSQLTHWSQFVWSKIHTSQWKLFCLIHWHKANY